MPSRKKNTTSFIAYGASNELTRSIYDSPNPEAPLSFWVNDTPFHRQGPEAENAAREKAQLAEMPNRNGKTPQGPSKTKSMVRMRWKTPGIAWQLYLEQSRLPKVASLS